MDGLGTYKWSKGHEYKGNFKDGLMEGQGRFVHQNGREFTGEFKRDLFAFVSPYTSFFSVLKQSASSIIFLTISQGEHCFINPLDDDKQIEKTVARLMRDVYISKDR